MQLCDSLNIHSHCPSFGMASLVTQTVKNMPAMQETLVWPLDWEDTLEKGTVTHSSTLAWKIPWMRELGGLQIMGSLKSQIRLSNFTFTFHFHALEKGMATHSSVLSWRIPGSGEPGGLPSMGSHRVGHDWSDLAAAAATQLWDLYRVQIWK